MYVLWDHGLVLVLFLLLFHLFQQLYVSAIGIHADTLIFPPLFPLCILPYIRAYIHPAIIVPTPASSRYPYLILHYFTRLVTQLGG